MLSWVLLLLPLGLVRCCAGRNASSWRLESLEARTALFLWKTKPLDGVAANAASTNATVSIVIFILFVCGRVTSGYCGTIGLVLCDASSSSLTARECEVGRFESSQRFFKMSSRKIRAPRPRSAAVIISKPLVASKHIHSQPSLFRYYHDAIICSLSNRSRESIGRQQRQISGKRSAAKIESVHHCQTNVDTAVLVYFDFIISCNDNART